MIFQIVGFVFAVWSYCAMFRRKHSNCKLHQIVLLAARASSANLVSFAIFALLILQRMKFSDFPNFRITFLVGFCPLV